MKLNLKEKILKLKNKINVGFLILHLFDVGLVYGSFCLSFFNIYYEVGKYPWILIGFGIEDQRGRGIENKFLIFNFFGKKIEKRIGKLRLYNAKH